MYQHIVLRLEPGCNAGQPCPRCVEINFPASLVNAAASSLGSLSQPIVLDPVTPQVPIIDTSSDVLMDITWATDLIPNYHASTEELIVTPTVPNAYVHDEYTPSFNNPFFEEFHAFTPRGASPTVDYY